ncbi:protein LDOC1-like [Ranitomeya imitator]|uniref:protein LDOC1-like n=1 Tax=Ranitomeya imitator TaxID=111125 RepID=UPI0037E83E72
MVDEQRLPRYIQQLEGRLVALEHTTSDVDVTAVAVQAGSVAADTLSTANPAPTLSSLPLPYKFAGDSKLCGEFVSQCPIHLELMAACFPTDWAKVGFIISLLSDRAFEWAMPLWEREDHVVQSTPLFLGTLKQVFLGPRVINDMALQLLALAHGSSMVSHFAVHFRTLASELE